MSFAGTALDAILKIKYNRELLQLHRAQYNELKKAVSNIKTKYHVFHDKNLLTDVELKKYKLKIRNKILRERHLRVIKTLTLFLIIAAILIKIFKMAYNFLEEQNFDIF